MRVLYPGGFDLLHHGHIAALQIARHIAGPNGQLLVAVNSDAFLAYYKRVPRRGEKERLQEVRDTGLVDSVFLWHGPEGQDEQILHATPDVYVAGINWLTDDLAQQLHLPNLTWFEEHNIGLLYLPRTPGISTTQLINAST